MREGFTLVEMIVVLAIFAVVLFFSLPFGLDAYNNYVLSSEERNLVSILRRAENLSLANNALSAHGVAIQNNQYVLYQGGSYVMRNSAFDEIYPKASIVSVSSTPDINFAPISGLPNGSTTIVLSTTIHSETITINNQGLILW